MNLQQPDTDMASTSKILPCLAALLSLLFLSNGVLLLVMQKHYQLMVTTAPYTLIWAGVLVSFISPFTLNKTSR